MSQEIASVNTPMNPVEFHGDTIYCVEYEGQPYTPVKPIVENLGLSWQPQAAKLKEQAARWSVTMIVIVAQDGKQREMLCVPVRKVAAFLATINPDKVREEIRSKLIRYQEECDEVLWQYWSTGYVSRESVRGNPHPLNETMQAARILFEVGNFSDNQLQLALDKIFRRETGYSALGAAEIRLLSPKQEIVLTPTEIGQQLSPALSPRVVNALLADAGYQVKTGKHWQPTKKADGMYELLDTNKRHSDGTPVKQAKWYVSTVDVVRQLAGQTDQENR